MRLCAATSRFLRPVAAVLGACLLAAASPALAAPASRLPQLILSGPSAAVSTPLIHMVESGALADLADKVEFVHWRDPDQLRAMALDGKADILTMPSSIAANLYNRGASVTLLNVSTWGVLWMVSRSAEKKTLADFRGEEIAMPFRGDMPDIVFQLLATKRGLDPRKDFKLRYVATPIEAMQLLVMRRVDHALLAEPAVSMALRKTKSFPIGLIAPELHRSADLQKEWGRLFNRPARIPQAGIAAIGALRERPEILARIEAAYARSLGYCRAHADECGRMVAKRFEILTPEAVADAIAVSQLDAVPAAKAREELDFFFAQLLAHNPALIGGKMPADAFYAPPARP